MFPGTQHRGKGDSAAPGGGRPSGKTKHRPGLFGRAWRLVRRVLTLGIGAAGVHSYLHLPHTPAPNKAEAIRLS